MDVLVLIDKLDDLVHNAKPVPLTDQVRVDKEEIYDILDQMRATIPEEIKQARWIVKERQEMLAEAKREAERIVREAREQQARLISDEEVTKEAKRLCEAMKHESQFIHDLLVDGVAGLISFVGARLGDSGVEEAWSWSLERSWKRPVETIAKSERREVAKALA